MVVLRIEHSIFDFHGWKAAFDADPVGRKQMGVRRYQILRPLNDPKYVIIDLEFETAEQAEAFLAAMREVWGRVEGTIMMNAKTQIVEVVEVKEDIN